MKLLLTSAGLTNHRISETLLSLLSKPVKYCSVVVIGYPLTTQEQDYIDEIIISLQQLGFDNIHRIDLKQPTFTEDLSTYDIIYMCGGNTYAILDRLQKTTLDKAIIQAMKNDQAIYIGVSAGSIIAGPDISIAGWRSTGDPNIVQLTNLTGFGFVNFSVFPHANAELLSEVEAFQKETHKQVITLTDEQAVLVENTKITLIQ